LSGEFLTVLCRSDLFQPFLFPAHWFLNVLEGRCIFPGCDDSSFGMRFALSNLQLHRKSREPHCLRECCPADRCSAQPVSWQNLQGTPLLFRHPEGRWNLVSVILIPPKICPGATTSRLHVRIIGQMNLRNTSCMMITALPCRSGPVSAWLKGES
jgi:hypothetical protein